MSESDYQIQVKTYQNWLPPELLELTLLNLSAEDVLKCYLADRSFQVLLFREWENRLIYLLNLSDCVKYCEDERLPMNIRKLLRSFDKERYYIYYEEECHVEESEFYPMVRSNDIDLIRDIHTMKSEEKGCEMMTCIIDLYETPFYTSDDYAIGAVKSLDELEEKCRELYGNTGGFEKIVRRWDDQNEYVFKDDSAVVALLILEDYDFGLNIYDLKSLPKSKHQPFRNDPSVKADASASIKWYKERLREWECCGISGSGYEARLRSIHIDWYRKTIKRYKKFRERALTEN